MFGLVRFIAMRHLVAHINKIGKFMMTMAVRMIDIIMENVENTKKRERMKKQTHTRTHKSIGLHYLIAILQNSVQFYYSLRSHKYFMFRR